MEGEVASTDVALGPTCGTAWCFLCAKRVGTSGRSSTNIFITMSPSSRQPLSSCIAATLHLELNQEDIPSPVVCKGCHKSVVTIDDLEVQLAELREEVITKHRKTSRLLQAGELPPSDTVTSGTPTVKEEKHSRKSKLDPKLDITEEITVTEIIGIPEDQVMTPIPQKRGRGRPSIKKKSLPQKVEEIDEVEQSVEKVPSEENNTVKEKVAALKENSEAEMSENGDVAEDNEATVDSDDLDFVPTEEDRKVKLTKSTPRPRGRPRNLETKRRSNGKKRGRPRIPIKYEMFDNVAVAGALDVGALEEMAEADADDPDAVFSCSACSSRFSVAGALIAHLRRRHGITVLMCDLCGMDFERKEELSEHIAKLHPPDEPEEEIEEVHDFDPELDAEGDFQCEVCNKLFYSLRFLRDHKRTHFGRNFVCDVCHKRFASRSLLDEHQNIHTGNRPYECNLCGKTFTSKYCLKVHIKIHEVRPRPFSCEVCSKTFMKPEHLSQHQRTHESHKDFMCGTCGKGFSSARNLEVHAVVHSGYKPFVCRMCGKAFARRAEILDHERTHTGERPFQCETCGATFSQRSNLQSHKRATHLDDRRFVCTQCGKSFKRRRLLDYHTRSVHTGERPYACSECNATFVYPEHFKKHRRIHTGEKPFRCEVCGKAFNSRDNRNAHRFIHSNKKPYECLVCGLGFMRKPQLYNHMQSQGHVHDTIVVNQPQVPQSGSNVVSEAAAAAGISSEKVYVTTTDDPEPQHVEEVEHVEHILIEGPVQFAEGEEENQNNHPRAILVPVTGGNGNGKDGAVQLVEIRLQGAPGEQPQWINLSTA